MTSELEVDDSDCSDVLKKKKKKSRVRERGKEKDSAHAEETGGKADPPIGKESSPDTDPEKHRDDPSGTDSSSDDDDRRSSSKGSSMSTSSSMAEGYLMTYSDQSSDSSGYVLTPFVTKGPSSSNTPSSPSVPGTSYSTPVHLSGEKKEGEGEGEGEVWMSLVPTAFMGKSGVRSTLAAK
jgi:hypothetical protein